MSLSFFSQPQSKLADVDLFWMPTQTTAGVLGDIELPCERTDITQTILSEPADRDLKGLRLQSQIATK